MGEKVVKDALKNLLEEDSDGVYEFLSRSSSRTFRDIENDGETHDLGAATGKDCQAQEGNRRNKRQVDCAPPPPTTTTTARRPFDPAPTHEESSFLERHVASPFLQRHVMSDQDFANLPWGRSEEEDQTPLQNIRTDRRPNDDVPRNTFIKASDLEKLVTESEKIDGKWQTKNKIAIVNVDSRGAYKLMAKIRFSKDSSGHINHMVGPATKLEWAPAILRGSMAT